MQYILARNICINIAKVWFLVWLFVFSLVFLLLLFFFHKYFLIFMPDEFVMLHDNKKNCQTLACSDGETQ
jgi:hypothetical protein